MGGRTGLDAARIRFNLPPPPLTARWCNGSTDDFDSSSHGSNPCRAAIRRAVQARLAHGLPGIGEHLIFKGGTSLSKVWRAVARFSEDIDVSLTREWLGLTGDRDPENAGSGKQQRVRIEELAAAWATKVGAELLPVLRERATQALGSKGWAIAVDPDDAQTLRFTYPAEMLGLPSAGFKSIICLKHGNPMQGLKLDDLYKHFSRRMPWTNDQICCETCPDRAPHPEGWNCSEEWAVEQEAQYAKSRGAKDHEAE